MNLIAFKKKHKDANATEKNLLLHLEFKLVSSGVQTLNSKNHVPDRHCIYNFQGKLIQFKHFQSPASKFALENEHEYV
jgi:hypothetical protein